ncbi:hypothetical protein H9P43_003051 [Blastocladiella emersonii ATCC 22665]|nr:hypothetical protein H9P43_003051 [Blastocladiella emersonii ATCC 22665]
MPKTEDLLRIPVTAIVAHLRLLGKSTARRLFMLVTLVLRELLTIGVVIELVSDGGFARSVLVLPLHDANAHTRDRPAALLALALLLYGRVAGLKFAAVLEVPSVMGELDRIQTVFTYATLHGLSELKRVEYGAEAHAPVLRERRVSTLHGSSTNASSAASSTIGHVNESVIHKSRSNSSASLRPMAPA